MPIILLVYHVAKAFHALCASVTEPAVFQKRGRMVDTSPHPSPPPGCGFWVKGALACGSPSDRPQAGGSEIHGEKGSAVCLMQTLSWGKLTPYHSHNPPAARLPGWGLSLKGECISPPSFRLCTAASSTTETRCERRRVDCTCGGTGGYCRCCGAKNITYKPHYPK